MCAATLRIFSAYGRAWRMRSCAFLIFEAATISMAFVILRVFCTLLILVRISLLPAIPFPCHRAAAVTPLRPSIRRVLLEVLDGVVQLRLVVLRKVLRRLDAVDEILELR